MNLLILGTTGMFGHLMFDYLSSKEKMVIGSVRSEKTKAFFSEGLLNRIIDGVQAEDLAGIDQAIKESEANVVINCIGIIKQLSDANNHEKSIQINALFPHQLARICKNHNARLIHISTDCVFSGRKGAYTEDDVSDAEDLYGKTKFLGEVVEYDNAVTLRTSIIGHELSGHVSLVDWFLGQENKVRGFTEAWYSGFTAVELARIIEQYILPDETLHGLYQVSSDPINKYELLKLVASTYGKDIEIVPDNSVSIDRTLDSNRFRKRTGYVPSSWEEMIGIMHSSYCEMKKRYPYIES